MTTRSDLTVRANLMIDDEVHKPESRYLPGDFVAAVFPEFRDRRVADTRMTPQQLSERDQYLVCAICGRTCAGTCGWRA
jgi:hypothetical protein